eukprot:TRINITY_DN3355_c0_g1_i1.p1 TRINITY_DN3355_c0_g1~~TRINITY_DN3355_c0_g1_i1.p1  ORF type:complete len:194 (+),score=42.50 TRINITY_DN3355_c0_g1_i1:66-647(+)
MSLRTPQPMSSGFFAAMDSEFPAFYSWPPFFTLQPTQETRQKQTQLWTELILMYSQRMKTNTLTVSEALRQPPFVNPQINRKLSEEAFRYFIDAMVTQGRAQWTDSSRTKCVLYSKRLEEWADIIYKWVYDSGLTDSVMTVYELHSGDSTRGLAFHGLDPFIITNALRVLETRGKAQIFRGDTTDEDGVKFFA